MNYPGHSSTSITADLHIHDSVDYNRMAELDRKLLQRGLPRVYEDATFTMRKRFNTDERKARNAERGLWGKADPTREDRGDQPDRSDGSERGDGPQRSGGNKNGKVDCSGEVYDCSDFDSYQEALRVLKACPGDPHNLDGNGDGEPCESLKD